ncbi:PIR Superfamily Protein [Plasmodium ovale wallikeri]|uniref:PIR Superfamily Protein n=1 Tax=Plasmodium ovale wallikeri TaxID=864142 RepID=A0A1A8YYG9_PLAOA|nr:PIR Superfamily Protein [Plasmodium ovale wallikeri]SBT37230.1 PIR Superfamily Protein [Plasmodium ovale wallikeri]
MCLCMYSYHCVNQGYKEYYIFFFEGNNMKNIGDIPVFHEFFDVIHNINYTLEQENKCYIDYNFDSTFIELGEIKYLHDYFRNFDSFETKFSFNETIKYGFYSYLTLINTLYEKYISECCTCYTTEDSNCEEECPSYFKCNEKYNPYNIYSKLECVNKLNKNFTKVRMLTPIDNYIKRLSKELEDNTH